ncbi:hypothetical protein ANANG_G00217400 [Anguilla anguilla]|uniref:tRNA (34-2'-O)-methyltransferase regulator WDR6 n=1 Tax=Anguilla anguilla TaxID=7936 RepID=A0A9D3LZ82_ANGAN|nr:hypothetical protein ANANG_G00217400 [Anguilla anguilla]
MAVLGFHSVSFVVWDVARRERLLSVPCGGGHRSWSYAPPPAWCSSSRAVAAARDPGGGGGVWGLRPGLHGRGAGCVCRLGRAGPWEVLASGEDTTLSVLAARPVGGELAVLSVVTDHISSVRALAAVPLGAATAAGAAGRTDGGGGRPLSALLISAGGRAQLQCYRLLIGWGPGPGPPTCQVIQVAGHRLDEQWERRRNRHKTVKMDPETRYMSLAVLHDGTAGVLLAVACSDGAVRVFSVSEVDRKFQLLWESFYHQRCVLSLAPCWMEDRLGNRRLFVFSGATDGSVALWDMSTLTAWRASSTAGLMWNGPGSPCFTVTVHQSGVNSLVVWEGHGEEADHEEEEAEPGEKEAAWMTVASGGDDGQLSVVNIRLQFPRPQVEGGAVSVQLQSRSSVPLAHAAPVTALQRLGPGLLVSTSPDQRVCLWQLTSPAPHQQDPAPHQQGPCPLTPQPWALALTSRALPLMNRALPHTVRVPPFATRGRSSRTWQTRRAWRRGLGLGRGAEPGRRFAVRGYSCCESEERRGKGRTSEGMNGGRGRLVMSRDRLPLIGSSGKTAAIKPAQPGLQRHPQAGRRKRAPPALATTGHPDTMAPGGLSLPLRDPKKVPRGQTQAPPPAPPPLPRLPPLRPVTNLSFSRSFTFSFFELPLHQSPRDRADRMRHVSLLLRQIQY